MEELIRSAKRAITFRFALWLLSIAAVSPVWSSENQLNSNTDLSTEGYFTLSWSVGELGQNILLQQSDNQEFASVREWRVSQSGDLTITGLEDGVYLYRIMDDSGATVGPIKVSVHHHGLDKAVFIFIVGLILFVVLLATIFFGAANVNRETVGRETADG